jgi:hypothetical protein
MHTREELLECVTTIGNVEKEFGVKLFPKLSDNNFGEIRQMQKEQLVGSFSYQHSGSEMIWVSRAILPPTFRYKISLLYKYYNDKNAVYEELMKRLKQIDAESEISIGTLNGYYKAKQRDVLK